MVHGILIVSPHTGIVVGQQLQAHTDLVGSHLVGTVHSLMGLGEGTCEILHVVADLVGNDVSISEGVTLDTQLALHLREERQVDVEFLVARTVEGAYGCCGVTTSRVDLIGEQHERG